MALNCLPRFEAFGRPIIEELYCSVEKPEMRFDMSVGSSSHLKQFSDCVLVDVCLPRLEAFERATIEEIHSSVRAEKCPVR